MKRFFPAVIIVGISSIMLFTGCIAGTTPTKNNAPVDSLARIEAEQFLSIGAEYYKQGNYDKAMENYAKALDINPDYYQAIVAKARTYQELRDLTNAEEWYRKAYTSHADSTAGYLGLSGIFLIKAQMNAEYLDSALQVYEEGVERFPDESKFYHGIAVVYERKGGVDAADSVYKAGVEVNPENWALLNSYVDFLMDKKRYDEAAKWETKLVEANTDDFIAKEKLADIYIKLKNYSKAEKLLTGVMALRPNDIGPMLKLANIYSIQKKYTKAESYFKKAIEMKPDKIVPRIYLGAMYLRQHKEAASEKVFKEILEMTGGNGDAYYFLGAIYSRKASRATTAKNVTAWKAGCANARTAENYFSKAMEIAPSQNSSRVRQQREHLSKVRAQLKKKLFLEGITDC